MLISSTLKLQAVPKVILVRPRPVSKHWVKDLLLAQLSQLLTTNILGSYTALRSLRMEMLQGPRFGNRLQTSFVRPSFLFGLKRRRWKTTFSGRSRRSLRSPTTSSRSRVLTPRCCVGGCCCCFVIYSFCKDNLYLIGISHFHLLKFIS